jgi:hypothetical protein
MLSLHRTHERLVYDMLDLLCIVATSMLLLFSPRAMRGLSFHYKTKHHEIDAWAVPYARLMLVGPATRPALGQLPCQPHLLRQIRIDG